MKKLAIVLGLALCTSMVHAQFKHGQLPAKQTDAEKQLRKPAQAGNDRFLKNAVLSKDSIRYPGEFEPTQAVLISWSDLYDDITGQYVGADTITEWGFVSAQLADAIQGEVPVWIRVYEAKDTVTVRTFMQNLGTPLTNYRFVVSRGDAWWMRDFGPNGVYYGKSDSLLFIDLKYYDGRELDDVYADTIGRLMQVPVYRTRLNAEGGNLMTDGFGTTFFSTVIANTNASVFAHNPPWSKNQTFDTLSLIFGAKRLGELEELSCDGGTGHIDLYTKMVDEQTIMVAKYPEVIRASDRQTIEDNYQYLASLQSPYNRPYRIYRIPHPTDDNGNYSRVTCNQMNDDARTFVNGLTVNKTFIYPSYSNDVDGNSNQTAEVTALFQNIFPGYRIVPIDSRALSPFGGELHCITMQIPESKPIHIWHPSVDRLQPRQSAYYLLAKVSHSDPISSVQCFWRIKGATNWSMLSLTDSMGYYRAMLQPGTLQQTDEVEYYLEVTAQSGKMIRKPLAAPDGFYRMYFTIPASEEEIMIMPRSHLYAPFPNPASDMVCIPYQVIEGTSQVNINVFDISGKLLFAHSESGVSIGKHHLFIPTQNWKPGMYFCTYEVNGVSLGTRKFTIY